MISHNLFRDIFLLNKFPLLLFVRRFSLQLFSIYSLHLRQLVHLFKLNESKKAKKSFANQPTLKILLAILNSFAFLLHSRWTFQPLFNALFFCLDGRYATLTTTRVIDSLDRRKKSKKFLFFLVKNAMLSKFALFFGGKTWKVHDVDGFDEFVESFRCANRYFLTGKKLWHDWQWIFVENETCQVATVSYFKLFHDRISRLLQFQFKTHNFSFSFQDEDECRWGRTIYSYNIATRVITLTTVN